MKRKNFVFLASDVGLLKYTSKKEISDGTDKFIYFTSNYESE